MQERVRRWFVRLVGVIGAGAAIIAASCRPLKSDGSDSKSTIDDRSGGGAISNEPPSSESAAIERTVRVEDGTALGVGKVFALSTSEALDGTRVDFTARAKDKKAVVVSMTSVGCPLSAKYGPRLAAIEEEFGKRGVAFFFVNAVAAESVAEMRESARDFGFDGAYLPDRGGEVSLALGSRTTTEVFVFDPNWKLAYRGAVDDQFGVGTARDRPKTMYLREALEAVLAGERAKVAATWAPGCLIDRPVAKASGGEVSPAPSAATPTYYGRIARILAASCVDCHRTGGAAPFNLYGPNALAGRASMVEAVVRDRLMPPSHGAASEGEGGGPWANRITLSDRDRTDLLTWLRSGRPLGDAAEAPPPRARPQGWAIGSPDRLLMSRSMILPAEGPLMHERVPIPTRFEVDHWATALEFRPMKAGSIHHALVWLVPPGAPMPEANALPASGAWTGGGSGSPEAELLGVYSPGHDLIRYDGEVARRFPAGSLIVTDIYARPMGKPLGVSLRIAMKATPVMPGEANPRKAIRTLTVQAKDLRVAPEDAHGTATGEWTLPARARVVAITPYMRARGRAIRVEARQANGDVRVLLAAPKYDFRWQVRYEYGVPVEFPGGTTIVVRGDFDNSSGNPNNPDSHAEVRSGVAVSDEALFAAIELDVLEK